MTGDPNKKTARTFQCRDVLWDNFETMARDLDCSVDYLINEAMKQYGKQRNLSNTMSGSGGVRNHTPEPGPSPHVQPSMPRLGAPTGLGLQRPAIASTTGSNPQVPAPSATGVSAGAPPNFGGTALRVPGAATTGSLPRVPTAGMPAVPQVPGRAGPPAMPRVPTMTGAAFTPPQLATPGAPPAMPVAPAAPVGLGGPPAFAAGVASQTLAGAGNGTALGTLSVLFNGERYPVNTERFIIGRGKQVSDLTVKDPNVSRQHAMIEYQAGGYYIVDMGSTNGVEFQGQRVTRKLLQEGDVCKICDYEFRFTFR